MDTVTLSRIDTLRALGVTPLRLRVRDPAVATQTAVAPQVAKAVLAAFDNRIALAPQPGDMDTPALAALYSKIGEAIASLGLQCVRVADAQADPRVRVLAFGDAVLPDSIAASRMLRADALAVLNADRARKRALWDALRRLAPEKG